jgi:glutathione peroxidase-family protein
LVESYKGKICRILAVAEICTDFTFKDVKGFEKINEKYQFRGKFIVSYI